MKFIPHPKINPYEADRKHTRLSGYDYSLSATYFVTFCTKERACYFGDIIDGKMHYSQQGVIAEICANTLSHYYPEIEMYNYVIMPDHVHLLLCLTPKNEKEVTEEKELNNWQMRHQAKTLSSIIGNYKSAVTLHCHRNGFEAKWLGSFFDRIVKDDEEKQAYDKYIDNNVCKWAYDSTHLSISIMM